FESSGGNRRQRHQRAELGRCSQDSLSINQQIKFSFPDILTKHNSRDPRRLAL
ncbi:hypothetical protein GUITHDRAFT_155938, partial [Guillardia theta CCMP2712]